MSSHSNCPCVWLSVPVPVPVHPNCITLCFVSLCYVHYPNGFYAKCYHILSLLFSQFLFTVDRILIIRVADVVARMFIHLYVSMCVSVVLCMRMGATYQKLLSEKLHLNIFLQFSSNLFV